MINELLLESSLTLLGGSLIRSHFPALQTRPDVSGLRVFTENSAHSVADPPKAGLV